MAILNLKRILFKNFIRSKVPDENFQELEDQVNANTGSISTLSASTSTSEIIAARDGYPTLQERQEAGFKHLGNGVVTEKKLLSSCDDSSGWTAGTGATALAFNTSEKVEGTGSLKMGKSTTTSDTIEYILDLADQSFENKNIVFNIFILDIVALGKIANLYFDITPDANFTTNYKRFTLNGYGTNWNKFQVNANVPTSITGTVNDDVQIQLLRLVIVTNNNNDTLTSGDLLLDHIFANGDELRVLEAATPDMSVRYKAGGWHVNGFARIKSADGTISGFTAPTSNPRYDLIVANRNGDVKAYIGAEAATPLTPKIPDNAIAIARIYHRVGSTAIKNIDDSTNSFIEDLRTLLADPQFFSNNYELLFNVANIFPVISYNADMTINTVTYKQGGSSGITIATATYTYTGVYVSQIVTVYGNVTFTKVYTYDSDNNITNIVVTKS